MISNLIANKVFIVCIFYYKPRHVSLKYRSLTKRGKHIDQSHISLAASNISITIAFFNNHCKLVLSAITFLGYFLRVICVLIPPTKPNYDPYCPQSKRLLSSIPRFSKVVSELNSQGLGFRVYDMYGLYGWDEDTNLLAKIKCQILKKFKLSKA